MLGINRLLKDVLIFDRDKFYFCDIFDYWLYWMKKSSFNIWGISLLCLVFDDVISFFGINEFCFFFVKY